MNTQAKFERTKKKGFGKTPNEFGRKRKEAPTFEPLPIPEMEDPRSDKEKMWARELDDDKLAKALYKLSLKWPDATLPELIMYQGLQRRHERFLYQVAVLGGRRQRGGRIPDFLVNWGGQGLAIQVQGDYWHGGPGAKEEDRLTKIKLLGVNINGLIVRKVVEVWESKLKDKLTRERVIDMALSGTEAGP